MNGYRKGDRIYNGVLFSHKEEWNSVIFRKIVGTGDHRFVNKINQTQKDNCHMFYFI
jgi:hypothetical protein